MVWFELCSGPGIGATGLEEFYSIDSAVDFDQDAIRSYHLNHPQTKTILKDIRDLDYLHGDYQSIAISSTTPCTKYSKLNYRKQNIYSKNKLKDFIEIINSPELRITNLLDEGIRAIREIRPRFGLNENVYSVPKVDKERFINQLKKLGYKGISKIVDAHQFGSAQIRKRWLTTFSLDKHLYPQPTQYRKFARDILDHSITESEIKPRAETLQKIQTIEAGKWVSLPGQNFKVYFVIDENKPLPAVVNPTKLRYIYPDRSRYLSFSELIKAFGLQKYEFVGTLSSKGQQLANGFPVELARAFAKTFYDYYGDLN